MATVYLTRKITFCASHRLNSSQLSVEENKRIFGKCNNENGHGHNYTLEVTIKGEIDPKTGMVMNITDLRKIMDTHVADIMDHKHLNLDVEVFKTVNPTAENMIVVIWKLLEPHLAKGQLFEVKLHETDNNTSIYRGE
ncbi:MAG: 6-carboxytetrahydropterin synthase [Methylotenera sp.]|nr:6-carboxytetrahydropterin synthase [Oligoflexia bacterium]